MTVKKKKKLKPRVGRVDIDFSSMSARPAKKSAKAVAWNPWPRCHPKCEHCFDLERDFESAQQLVEENEEEIEDQLRDIQDAKKEMAEILVKMKKHVKTQAHKDGVARGEM